MRHTPFRRRAFFATLAVLWVAGLVVTWLWFRLDASADRPSGTRSVPGLADSVFVKLDSLGIPTVRAAGEPDAWRALGWLHASDRLWQLEFYRRIGTGRLAELFGPRALPTDRFVRTLGLPRIAARATEGLPRAEREALEAYAAGVNARLRLYDELPPEFQLLRFEPEPWKVEHSLVVGLVMNLDLSHWRRDLARHRAAGALPPEKTRWLHPSYPEWGPRTLAGRIEPPEGVVTGFETSGADLPAASSGAAVTGVATEATAAALPGWDPFEVLAAVSIRAASNAWVIGPARTAAGHPILANDMHLALRAPSIWYVAALHAEEDDLHVAGFTLPGVPGVIVGFNRAVAWGATNAMVDDMDFVVETVERGGRRYASGGAWLEFQVRPETIRVRGADTRIDTVRATVRGPVISDVLDWLDGTVSVLFVPERVPVRLGGLFAMNRAGSMEEFQAAAREFTGPHLNLVVAGADGRIGYQLAGSIPRRSWDGALPAPAEVVGTGWPGMWPAERHPSVTDPERAYIVTANNLQSDGLDGAIGADWPAPFRAQRITQALSVRRDWTVAATAELQRDVRSLLAERTLGRAIDAARRLGEAAVADTLAAWDLRVDVASHAAPLFYAWFYGLRSLVAADEWEGLSGGPSLFPTISMLRVLEEAPNGGPWVDDVATPNHVETLAELEERAMAAAIGNVDGRRWGDLHQERHAHPLGTMAWLDRVLGFHVGPYPAPGGPNTVRPDSYQMWQRLEGGGPTPPWISEYGPSERLVVEMRPDGPRGRLLIPTGQSGNPFSPHYRDMSEIWRADGLVPLGLDSEADEPTATIVLVPERR